MKKTLIELPISDPIILDNLTCVYCGTELSALNNTKEHVIGRRFVPKGNLHGQWNLIVRACSICNGKKADLENDISAITMHADARGKHSTDDEALVSEAKRKARNSISRRTGKPVCESIEKFEIKVPLCVGGELTIDLIAPPQIESSRIYELSRMQLMAFFYWITYNRETKRGGFWIGSFFPVLEAPNSDWGNPVHKHFMDTVFNWEPRVLSIGALGFFKVMIRRHPLAVCWSWALEWNNKLRVVGFFGENEPTQKVLHTFPSLETVTMAQGPNKYAGYRSEKHLDEKDDCLFKPPCL